jgi:ApbE superfamily uncharacterized protein (UPF0280 family)
MLKRFKGKDAIKDSGPKIAKHLSKAPKHFNVCTPLTSVAG